MTSMYSWIWRHLPFGLPGKLIGSAVLIAGAVAALWFWAFPALEPLLPFDDAQVSADQPGDIATPPPTPATSGPATPTPTTPGPTPTTPTPATPTPTRQ